MIQFLIVLEESTTSIQLIRVNCHPMKQD